MSGRSEWPAEGPFSVENEADSLAWELSRANCPCRDCKGRGGLPCDECVVDVTDKERDKCTG